MEVGSQFDNCSLVNSSELIIANLIDVTTNAASFVLLLLFLALLVLHKACKTTLQRLLLCLTIVTALYAMVTSLNIELQFDFQTSAEFKFCKWIGFSNAWISNLIELFSLAFTVQLITITYQSFKGREINFLNSCRKHPVLAEIVCILVITLLPLSYLSKPLADKTFGRSGTLCWINVTCKGHSRSGNENAYLSVIMLFLHLTVTLAFAILIIVITMNTVKVRYSRGEYVGTIRKTAFLIIVIAITLFIRTAQFGVYMAINFKNETTTEYRYVAYDSTLYSITNVMVPLGFAVYLYSPKKLGITSLRKAAKQWGCCKRRSIYRNMKNTIGDDDGLVSIESSIKQDSPSQTTAFRSKYTNQFTDITENVSMSSPQYGTLRTHGLS